jgi:hypothetical protein
MTAHDLESARIGHEGFLGTQVPGKRRTRHLACAAGSNDRARTTLARALQAWQLRMVTEAETSYRRRHMRGREVVSSHCAFIPNT